MNQNSKQRLLAMDLFKLHQVTNYASGTKTSPLNSTMNYNAFLLKHIRMQTASSRLNKFSTVYISKTYKNWLLVHKSNFTRTLKIKLTINKNFLFFRTSKRKRHNYKIFTRKIKLFSRNILKEIIML